MDLVKLLGIGICLAFALVLLGAYFTFRKPAQIQESRTKKESKSEQEIIPDSVVLSETKSVVAATPISSTTNPIIASSSVSIPIATNTPLSAISIIIIVLLVIMGLFWLGVGFLQLGTSAISFSASNMDPEIAELLEMENSSTLYDSGVNLVMSGIWNVIISIINLLMIRNVVKREKKAVRYLTLLGVLGFLWGGIQLLSGSFLQICAIPLYLVLAVLAQINKQEYIN